MSVVAGVTMWWNGNAAIECIARVVSRLNIHVVLISQPRNERLSALVVAHLLLFLFMRSFNHESALLTRWALTNRLLGRLIEMCQTVFSGWVVMLLVIYQADANLTTCTSSVSNLIETLPASFVEGVLLLSPQLFVCDTRVSCNAECVTGNVWSTATDGVRSELWFAVIFTGRDLP